MAVPPADVRKAHAALTKLERIVCEECVDSDGDD
jgi:hypothetical protein